MIFNSYGVLGEKTGAQNIVKEIKQYQKKWLQHVQRMDTNRIPKQALQYRPKGRRNIGRPKKRWRDQLHFEDQGKGNTPNPSGTWWWWWWTLMVISVLGYLEQITDNRLSAFPYIFQFGENYSEVFGTASSVGYVHSTTSNLCLFRYSSWVSWWFTAAKNTQTNNRGRVYTHIHIQGVSRL